MSRKKNSAREAQSERSNVIPGRRPEIYTAEYAGYLVCDLTVAHEKQLEAYTPSWEELGVWQSEMVDSGLKVVQVFSKDGASVRVELHDMDKSSEYAGWRLSAFAENLYDALVVLKFKQEKILNGDWSLAATERQARRFG